METIFTYHPDEAILEEVGISVTNESDYIKHLNERYSERMVEITILDDLVSYFELSNNKKEVSRIETKLEAIGYSITEGLE